MMIEPGDPARCCICGCTRVSVDEVECDGILLLTECSRCHHRRTVRPSPPGVARHPAAAFPQVRHGLREVSASPAVAAA